MKDIDYIDVYKRCLLVLFALIMIYSLGLCVFSNYILEILMSKVFPLSIMLVAISILFFAIDSRTKK